MRITGLLAIMTLLLGGCRPGDPVGPAGESQPSPASTAAIRDAAGWELQSDEDGVALALLSATGVAAIRLSCSTRQTQLQVNVPSFRPIASEERLSFGSGDQVIALVADARGDSQRGGVTGSGPQPDELKSLIWGPIVVSYGAQKSGPHPAPAREVAAPFLAKCSDYASDARRAATVPKPGTSPCLIQDGRLLQVAPFRAVGTEPFWGARVEGRCVIYSTPEDQTGTRVWTRLNDGPAGGIWVGSLGGKPFVLRTEPAVNCSDGMSDKRYPFAANLEVGGEQRTGCAEPL